jgi:hypothetical protein
LVPCEIVDDNEIALPRVISPGIAVMDVTTGQDWNTPLTMRSPLSSVAPHTSTKLTSVVWLFRMSKSASPEQALPKLVAASSWML